MSHAGSEAVPEVEDGIEEDTVGQVRLAAAVEAEGLAVGGVQDQAQLH